MRGRKGDRMGKFNALYRLRIIIKKKDGGAEYVK